MGVLVPLGAGEDIFLFMKPSVGVALGLSRLGVYLLSGSMGWEPGSALCPYPPEALDWRD